MHTSLKGVIPVLYTPFDDRFRIDDEDMRRQVELAVKEGADAVLVNASDSECLKLTSDERKHAAEVVAEQTRERVPLVVGVSAAGTAESQMLAEHAREIGAAAVLSLPPVTGDLGSASVYAHFAALDRVGRIPIMVQERSSQIGDELVLRMAAELEHVAYIKEERSPGAGRRIAELVALATRLAVFSGGENSVNELFRGAAGIVPSCVCLSAHVRMYRSHTNGQLNDMWEEYERVLPLLSFRRQVNSILLTKEILVRAGVFKSGRSREPVGIELDEGDLQMLGVLTERVGKLT